MAGAVLRAQGSNMTVASVTPMAASCASTKSAWVAFATMMGEAKRSRSITRRTVSWNIVWVPVNAWNCFGRSGVDIGHNRVPPPPDRMTGVIFTFYL